MKENLKDSLETLKNKIYKFMTTVLNKYIFINEVIQLINITLHTIVQLK